MSNKTLVELFTEDVRGLEPLNPDQRLALWMIYTTGFAACLIEMNEPIAESRRKEFMEAIQARKDIEL